MNHMDIRIDTAFHHKNPNVYIPPSCVRNPDNQYSPKYMPLTIFNLSKVDHLYIGRDTVIAFTEQPTIESYNIQLASDDAIKEHLAKPSNWVPQRHVTLPEMPLILLLFVLQQMCQVPARCNCRIRIYQQMSSRDLKNYARNMDKHSPRIMRTSAQQSLYKWTLTQETAHQ